MKQNISHRFDKKIDSKQSLFKKIINPNINGLRTNILIMDNEKLNIYFDRNI